jgi:CPA2 family monovalent cation:H+ antiporter-2
MVLSMLSTPFIIARNPSFREAGGKRLAAAVAADDDDRAQTINTAQHVIICGYGRCGQNLLACWVRASLPGAGPGPGSRPTATAAGDSVVFGDAARCKR